MPILNDKGGGFTLMLKEIMARASIDILIKHMYQEIELHTIPFHDVLSQVGMFLESIVK